MPEQAYAVTLDSDPGWTMAGDWAYGVPQGLGGEYGGPDPVSGYTGANVLGYNLAGDYPADLPPTHLTSGAFDCSALTGTTLASGAGWASSSRLYDHATIRPAPTA